MVGVKLKLNTLIYWITPIRLKVNLSTVQMESHAIKNNIYNKSKPITISLPTNKLEKVGIIRNMMPNLKHSSDASNIHMLIKHLDGGTTIYTIHVCFASLPNSIKRL